MASKTVDEYIDCERCPNRIFNTGKYIQGGRGSIHGDIVSYFLEVIEFIVMIINYSLILVIFTMNTLDEITLKMYI